MLLGVLIRLAACRFVRTRTSGCAAQFSMACGSFPRCLVGEGEAERAFARGAATEPSAADRALAEHLSAIALAAAVEMATEDRGEASDEDDNPEDSLARAELIHFVRGALDELSNVEAEVVSRHYFDGERLEDIARDLDMSKSWASRVQTRAVNRLAKRLRSLA